MVPLLHIISFPPFLSDVQGSQRFRTAPGQVIDCMAYLPGSGGENTKQKQNQTSACDKHATRPQCECLPPQTGMNTKSESRDVNMLSFFCGFMYAY